MDKVTAYPTDVGSLSDAELETLSGEIEEAYLRSNSDGEPWWLDDDGENRYYEIHREIRRRWEIANPEAAALESKEVCEFASAALKVLSNNLCMSKIAGAFEAQFGKKKIGDTLTVRKPPRFIG